MINTNGCQCGACKLVLHASSCAVHNAPAYPVGPCDCGAVPAGYVLVPAVAAKAMLVAAVKYANGDAIYDKVPLAALEIEESIYGEAYAAMIAAAPQPNPTPLPGSSA